MLRLFWQDLMVLEVGKETKGKDWNVFGSLLRAHFRGGSLGIGASERNETGRSMTEFILDLGS